MPGPTYLSIVEIPGDGVTTQHEFNFAGGYIDRTHVKAWVSDARGVITPVTVTPGMFVTDFVINLGVAAPVGGKTRIYRETPKEVPLVDFAGGARVTEENLDKLTRQAILAVAEAFDAGAWASVNDLLGQAGAAAAAAQSSATAAADSALAADADAATAAQAALDAQGAMTSKLDKAANLSDLTDVPAARTALGLGTAATRAALGTAGSLYSRDSILGAVGQTGGVPTGAIIEVVTNANGTAVKFADGTMIARFVEASQRTITQAQGSLYLTATAPSFTFPVAFAAAPDVVPFTTASANAPTWAGNSGPNTTTTGPIYGFSATNTATARLGYVAIGRWF